MLKQHLNFLSHHVRLLLVEAALIAGERWARFVDKRKAESIHLARGYSLGVFGEDSAKAAKQLKGLLTLRNCNLAKVSLGDIHIGRRVKRGARFRRRSGGG